MKYSQSVFMHLLNLKPPRFVIDKKGRIWRFRILKPGKLVFTRADRRSHNKLFVVSFRYKGSNFTVMAHQLVWIKFYGDIPPGLEPNHKDGNSFNNRPGNLELVTRSENLKHNRRGLYTITSSKRKTWKRRNIGIKLTLKQAWTIRKLYDSGTFSYKSLAEQFNVSKATIEQIVKFKIWNYRELY